MNFFLTKTARPEPSTALILRILCSEKFDTSLFFEGVTLSTHLDTLN